MKIIKKIFNLRRLLWLIIPLIIIMIGELFAVKFKKQLIHNLTYNPAFDGILFLLFFIFIAYLKFKKYQQQKEEIEKGKYSKDEFIKEKNINLIQEWFLDPFITECIETENNKDNLFDEKFDTSECNKLLQQIEPDKHIQEQIKNAKNNQYNNSYLAFCMLIDRCIDVANNKQQPYCFQEIAEAFGLEWKGRRYLAYIAYRLLGTIGELLVKENENKEGNEKIPCVNASVVTKWERDHGNKWFCNGGIKATTWCCYPPYTSKDGEDDREFILELCEIVKQANEDEKDKSNDKIKTWKETYYKLLKEKNGSLKDKTGLDEVYKKYKENGIKMSYQELEK